MSKLNSLMACLASRNPPSFELTVERMTQTVYLVDWKSALEFGEQVTSITWFYGPAGPMSQEILRIAGMANSPLIVRTPLNSPGRSRASIALRDRSFVPKLPDRDLDVVGFVLNTVLSYDRHAIAKLVLSTFPFVSNSRYTKLDLVKSAKEYKRLLNAMNVKRDSMTTAS